MGNARAVRVFALFLSVCALSAAERERLPVERAAVPRDVADEEGERTLERVTKAGPKPVTIEGRGFALELDYRRRGPHGKPRRMNFFRSLDGVVGIEVSDEFGIGGGVVRLLRGKWPGKLRLRLRLEGLEGLNVSVGKKTLERAALDVRLLTPAGEPLEGKYRQDRPGHYEAVIPAGVLDGAEEVRLSWVDFYRG